jgi:hypothetical protein
MRLNKRARGDAGQSEGAEYAIGISVIVFLVLLVIWAILFVMGWKSVPVDKVGLHYKDGPIQGQHFDEIIQPGTGARFLGLADDLVLLPITQRSYIASRNPNEGDRKEADTIKAPARGGVEMEFEFTSYFKLATGKADVMRKFYETLCVKYHCDEGDDQWDAMLNDQIRKPIENALQQAIRNYTVNELYAGQAGGGTATDEQAASLLRQVQDQVARDLKDNVNAVFGEDYFCGPTYDRAKPDECPAFSFNIISATPTDQGVRDSFTRQAASANDVLTSTNKANAAVAEAKGQQAANEALAGIYSDPNYASYLRALAMQACANNSNCTLVVSDGGTGVNVNTGTK